MQFKIGLISPSLCCRFITHTEAGLQTVSRPIVTKRLADEEYTYRVCRQCSAGGGFEPLMMCLSNFTAMQRLA